MTKEELAKLERELKAKHHKEKKLKYQAAKRAAKKQVAQGQAVQ